MWWCWFSLFCGLMDVAWSISLSTSICNVSFKYILWCLIWYLQQLFRLSVMLQHQYLFSHVFSQMSVFFQIWLALVSDFHGYCACKHSNISAIFSPPIMWCQHTPLPPGMHCNRGCCCLLVGMWGQKREKTFLC